jgi:hypothetical protein
MSQHTSAHDKRDAAAHDDRIESHDRTANEQQKGQRSKKKIFDNAPSHCARISSAVPS